MARTPAAESPPRGLTAYWLGVWRCALRVLKEQGTWSWEQKPLLDEYVHALRGAEAAREGLKWLDALEAYANANSSEMPQVSWATLGRIASGLPAQWDRHVKRAAALADQLALTPRGRKAAGIRADQGDDPFAQFATGGGGNLQHEKGTGAPGSSSREKGSAPDRGDIDPFDELDDTTVDSLAEQRVKRRRRADAAG